MNQGQISFTISQTSNRTRARRGVLITPHGTYRTPLLVKPLSADSDQGMAWTSGLRVKLAYHEHELKRAGGLPGLLHWPDSLIVASGSSDVFNNGHAFKLDQKGIHYVGAEKEAFLSPEVSVREAAVSGADIAIALSDCPPYYSSYDHLKKHTEQNNRWMKRATQAHDRQNVALFGVIEGGGLKELRQISIDFVTQLGFAGYVIGGLTKDVALPEASRLIQEVVPRLPAEAPRLLERVGDKELLSVAINSGVDILLASPDADLRRLQQRLSQINANF